MFVLRATNPENSCVLRCYASAFAEDAPSLRRRLRHDAVLQHALLRYASLHASFAPVHFFFRVIGLGRQHTDLLCLLGIDHLAGQAHLHGLRLAHPPRQPLRAATPCIAIAEKQQ